MTGVLEELRQWIESGKGDEYIQKFWNMTSQGNGVLRHIEGANKEGYLFETSDGTSVAFLMFKDRGEDFNENLFHHMLVEIVGTNSMYPEWSYSKIFVDNLNEKPVLISKGYDPNKTFKNALTSNKFDNKKIIEALAKNLAEFHNSDRVLEKNLENIFN